MATVSKLGHFNLLEEIGKGGMGTVYRAFDSTLNREVAIKVLREDLAKDQKFLSDFLQEARNAAAISHPHIVQVHFVGEEAGHYYIVMELLKGRTLREIIEGDGPVAEERALDLAIDVAEALRAAYRNQMIHGDIKPANIFVVEDVGAKVLDFGLAKLANVEAASDEGIWGSPYYVSPERVGRKPEDFRSDVYSLGATLFQTLTGRPPFDAESPDELALKRLNEKPPLLRDINANIAAKTEQVVNKMLNKSIFLRYRDYTALLEDLRDAKTEATAKRLGVELHPERKPPVPVIPLPPAPKRSPVPLVITGAVVVLLVVGILAFVFWPRQKPKPTPTPPPAAQQKPLMPTATTPTPQKPPQQPAATTTSPSPKPPSVPPTSVKSFDVTFTYNAPSANRVFIAGDFNNWSEFGTPMRKRPNGEWSVTVALNPGRHTYKFVVDGKWVADPENTDRESDGHGGFNSVVVISP